MATIGQEIVAVFNVCPACGRYSVERAVVCPGPLAVCPHCGHEYPFLQLPLFIVTGASGTGKTTVALGLVPVLRGDAVVLDADILWGPEFATPKNDYRRFHEVWLRLAKNIGQAGLPVVLAGTFLPDQLEDLPERRYFSALHFLGLVADEEDLVRRLQSRPAWRGSAEPDFIEAMVQLNGWLKVNAETTLPPIQLLDTCALSPEQIVQVTAAWFRSQMANPLPCVPFPLGEHSQYRRDG